MKVLKRTTAGRGYRGHVLCMRHTHQRPRQRHEEPTYRCNRCIFVVAATTPEGLLVAETWSESVFSITSPRTAPTGFGVVASAPVASWEPRPRWLPAAPASGKPGRAAWSPEAAPCCLHINRGRGPCCRNRLTQQISKTRETLRATARSLSVAVGQSRLLSPTANTSKPSRCAVSAPAPSNQHPRVAMLLGVKIAKTLPFVWHRSGLQRTGNRLGQRSGTSAFTVGDAISRLSAYSRTAQSAQNFVRGSWLPGCSPCNAPPSAATSQQSFGRASCQTLCARALRLPPPRCSRPRTYQHI